MGNFATTQNFQLPDASSDFVGDWCGWSHLSSCDPPGTCDEESEPSSMRFKDNPAGWLSGSSHSITLEYSILTQPDVKIENIQVRALNPHHVQVTFTEIRNNSLNEEVATGWREDIVSVNPAVVQDTSYATLNGVTGRSKETTVEMRKCSPEFEVAQKEYMEREHLVENGEVSGQVPK
jgi:hypothetical protein